MNTSGWTDPGGSAGDRTRLWHQAQIASGARVGADCTLGKGAYVGTGAVIGDRVKIGNYACVFGAVIADEVMICPGALLLEDPAPRATTPEGARKSPSDFTRRPVRVGPGATIGAGAVIAPGVTIGARAMVAIGAAVVRDVAAHALVAGNPARPCGWACACGATLDPDLRCGCGRVYTLTGQILASADAGEPA
jgi:acetyltransferase-like isoleucine patch superfamily enzyme